MSKPAWTLPGYLVDDLLGVGGSGDVWRGRMKATGQPVALKRLAIDDPQRVRAARAEAAILQTLDHPNLIRLHDVVVIPDAVVLVLDLAAGGSLNGLLQARGRLTPGEVVAAVAPVAAALAYAHTVGVTHADVTPANVLFTDIGLPLLADLGVARLIGDVAPARGTPAYLDPTVAAGALPGPHSDVFMVAGVALHALTGAPPWPGDSADTVLAEAARGELDVSARLAAAAVPEPMRELLVTALSTDPTRRGTAADFALELRHAAEPVAVELAAGRRRAEVTYPVPPSAGSGAVRVAWQPVAAGGEVAARPALTRGVRARPVAARPVRRPVWRRPATRIAAASCAAVLGAAAALAWSAHRGRPAEERAPGQASALATLTRLDTVRAQAFAQRQPQLLSSVYLPGPLLDADAALLTRLVPAGCGLVGARTTYREVKVVATSPDELVVVASVTLARSTLVCAGSATGIAPPVGPRQLRIRLVRAADGYRLAGQQPG